MFGKINKKQIVFVQEAFYVNTISEEDKRAKIVADNNRGLVQIHPNFKIYFDFCYYNLITPFRFKLNLEKDCYIIHKNWVQTVSASKKILIRNKPLIK